MNLSFSPIFRRVRRLMRDGQERTSAQAADDLCAGRAVPPEWWRVSRALDLLVYLNELDAWHAGECWHYCRRR